MDLSVTAQILFRRRRRADRARTIPFRPEQDGGRINARRSLCRSGSPDRQGAANEASTAPLRDAISVGGVFVSEQGKDWQWVWAEPSRIRGDRRVVQADADATRSVGGRCAAQTRRRLP